MYRLSKSSEQIRNVPTNITKRVYLNFVRLTSAETG